MLAIKSFIKYNIDDKDKQGRSNICIIGVPDKESRTSGQKKFR